MDLERLNPGIMREIAQRMREKQIADEYNDEIENLLNAAYDGYENFILENYEKDLKPLLYFLHDRGFKILLPAGPDAWRLDDDLEEDVVNRYKKFLISWEAE